MAFGTFRIVHPDDQVVRHNLKVHDTTHLNPMDANALEQGEWLTPDGGTPSEWDRTAADHPAIAYPICSLKGATDVQSRGKVEVYKNWVEAITTSYDPNGTYNVGTALKVNLVDIGAGVMRSVLQDNAASGDNVQAEVVLPPTDPTAFDEMRIRYARYQLV